MKGIVRLLHLMLNVFENRSDYNSLKSFLPRINK